MGTSSDLPHKSPASREAFRNGLGYRVVFFAYIFFFIALTNVFAAQPVKPDSPLNTPKRESQTSALAIGDTSVTHDAAAKKVKLRVSDGWDLDQYLFADSSPLDFYIDLKGFQPHPTQPTTLTMRVWDVDQAGDPGFPECAFLWRMTPIFPDCD